LKRNPQKGAFWQPVTGGIKVKRSESPEDAAIREVKEETSLQGQLIDLNYTHSFYLQPNLMKREHPDPQVNREYSFALRTNKTDVIIDPKEHDEYAWLTYEEAKERLIWNGNLRALELTKKFIEKS
ncbi:MAG: NUDIX pyrophosphatase, partial [Blastocatellia bacterium]|nr:NUDIX pyrophosphatase [Blastocatellia bacterium]